jgi:hypothetical protein
MYLLLLASFIIISVFIVIVCLCDVLISSLAGFASLPCPICSTRPLLLIISCLQLLVAVKKRRRREEREPKTFLAYIRFLGPPPFSLNCAVF